MSIKVSNMTSTNQVKTDDVFMIVQDGANKKISANLFQLKSGTAENANSLNGHTSDEFVMKSDGVNNADQLGGVPANQYATKDYVDNSAGTSTIFGDPTWCCPKMWFSTSQLPNNDATNWHFCDGTSLKRADYADLYSIIGLQFTRDEDGEVVDDGVNFQLPNLNGAFILGANTKTSKLTTNLPAGLYPTDNICFNQSGQFKFPEEVGIAGGDPTTAMVDVSQVPAHTHQITKHTDIDSNHVQAISNSGNGAYAFNSNTGSTKNTTTYGNNTTENFSYPTSQSTANKGMLTMPPFVTFAWVMRIKPPSM